MEFGEKMQNKAIIRRSRSTVQGHSRSSRSVPSKAHMRLPLIVTDNLYRTVTELSQLIVQIWDTLRFEPPNEPKMNIVQCPLGTLYDVHLGLIGWLKMQSVHLGLIGKCAVDFLLVIIELRCYG